MKLAIIFFIVSIAATTSLPHFNRFEFTDREMYAEGIVTNAIESGEEQPSLRTSLAISQRWSWMLWDLEESHYFLTANGTYITIVGIPGICFRVPNFTFADEGNNWSSLRHTLNVKMQDVSGRKERRVFTGMAISDVGSCCDSVAGTVFTSRGGDIDEINELVGEQLFPAFGGPNSTIRSTLVMTRLMHDPDSFRRPRRSDFYLPSECENPVADFCATFYKQYGFCNEETNTAVPLHFPLSPAARDMAAARSARFMQTARIVSTYNNVRYRGITYPVLNVIA